VADETDVCVCLSVAPEKDAPMLRIRIDDELRWSVDLPTEMCVAKRVKAVKKPPIRRFVGRRSKRRGCGG
jgi:hypothetical protein